MNLWLDDQRDPKFRAKERKWKWVKTAGEAISIIGTGRVKVVSLDHDLGCEEKFLRGFTIGNGYMVASFIEEQAFLNQIPRLEWHIHSQNPVGVEKMRKALENADRYWTSHGK